ncbi:MAG: sigma-70 family RNA polymerase sigma factor [bacterium]
MSKTDNELWIEIMADNEKAWNELVEKYQSLVYAVCTRSKLSTSDAADCFQQTWISLLENKHNIKDPSRLSAWLVTTAKREVLRYYRSAERSVPLEENPEFVDKNILPDEELARLESQAHLELAIKELHLRCQKLIKLLFYSSEKYSYKNLAKDMDLDINSLGALRNRCLKRLKNILIKNGFLEELKEGL